MSINHTPLFRFGPGFQSAYESTGILILSWLVFTIILFTFKTHLI